MLIFESLKVNSWDRVFALSKDILIVKFEDYI